MKTFLLCTLTLFALGAAAPLADAAPDGPHGRKHKRWSIQVGHGGIGIRYERHRQSRPVHRHWVPGYWDDHVQRYQEPGHYERVWIPARYEWRYDRYGRAVRACVAPGHYEQRWVPGCWRSERRPRWVPGHWEDRRR